MSGANLDFQQAMQLWGDGRSPESEALLKQALTKYQQLLGPDDPEVAKVLERLGALSFNRQNYGEAETLFRNALSIEQKAYGEKNADTAYIMGDVGAALREQRRCTEAQAIVEHSLAIYREILPRDDAIIADRLNNLGRIFLCERRYEDARRTVQASLSIYSTRSLPAGMRDDEALLKAIDSAERTARDLVAWSVRLAIAALISLFVVVACDLSSELRNVTDPTKRPLVLRITRVGSLIALLASVSVLCAFNAGFLIIDWMPWIVGDRYTLQNIGKLGLIGGAWLSLMAVQIVSNLGRRTMALPTQRIRWSGLQSSETRVFMRAWSRPSSPTHEELKNIALAENWFVAAERRPFMWNRFYKVFITEEMLCGAKATISAFSNVNALVADPVDYVLRSTPSVYEKVDTRSPSFLAVNRANFQIAWRDVEAVSFDPAKKSGLGFLPQAGAITLLGRSGKKLELVLLGFQDGETLTSRLRRSVDDVSTNRELVSL